MPHVTEKVYLDLHDNNWYVTINCPLENHDPHDEKISFEDAKTPWSATAIAEARHQECHDEAGELAVKESRHAEIDAAKEELKRAEACVKRSEQEVKDIEAEADDLPDELWALYERRLREAKSRVKRYKDGVKEAKKRVTETRKQNTSKK